MLDIARLKPKDLSDLIRLTASKRGLTESLIEKDFWVSFVLAVIFEQTSFKDCLLFKGGTSLSKAYGLIKRFSEDIDVILDWRELGISDESAWKERNSTQKDKFNDEVDGLGAKYIKEKMLPELIGIFSEATDNQVNVSIDEDPHTINIQFPRLFPNNYLLPQVKLEIGPRASRVPFEEATITSFIAEEYSHLFVKPSCTVRTIKSVRTFWEKVTILHHIANMAEDKIVARRQSRHFYDVYEMVCSEFKDEYLKSLDVLDEVVKFKQQFYYVAAAKYELAKPGTLRLIPSEKKIREIEKDFIDMGGMIFGSSPDFSSIISELEIIESLINDLT